ncbi:sigma-70 family RNA polymerase sigma factor [Actinoplanes hulinensis]|uniref:Sigma-70 family RNA polymerase sigma factor n=1 Tax=Actinoplanes hulinensis TaxID=1144547 RepID=A0ABS7BF91_9ACTN|nr:sigma-70 family RNA polymerase sigma factor [Actinoplanes hulinensis]MBW6439549.1 sigma-70 family RNA polymerase sigma factor [Actinoplanes hulinensis]
MAAAPDPGIQQVERRDADVTKSGTADTTSRALIDDKADPGGYSRRCPRFPPGIRTVRREARLAIIPALAGLGERERRILTLRFYGNLTQAAIAQQVGISQMHVSRLIARALGRLRSELRQDSRIGDRGPGPHDHPRVGPAKSVRLDRSVTTR